MVAEEAGTHYIYFKNDYSSSYYKYYLQIYNLTTGTTIRSSSTVSSTSYSNQSFTCSKGDVIVISLYRYNTSYSSYAYFYFSGFSSPAASSATASLPAAGIEYKNNSTYIDSVDYGANYTLPVPTRTGYTFGGWYNGNTKVENGAWNIASNVTLTAKWTANTYTVTFNANGGTVSPTSKTATYDSSFTLPTPTWDGHTFSGWYNGSTKITSGTWNYTTSMNLTAHWDAVDYTISYTMNGGTNNSSNPSTYTVNDSFTLKEPTKTGYTFLGWTYSGQTTPTKNVTISAGTMGNLSYTANWEIIDYTVTLNANGGSVTPSSLTVNYNTSFTLPTPTRTGYTFAGWYNGSTQYTSGTWTDLTDVTLTAKWTVNEYTLTYEDVSEVVDSITVTFNYNYSGSTSSTVTLTNGQTLAYPTVPTRSGYAFAGWYTNSSCTTAYSFSGTLTADTTLYAKWVSMTSSYSTREYVDIKNYNSSSSKKSITVTASSSSSQNYYYFTCYKAGTYNFYSAYATGDFYITVYNATTGSYILEKTNLYSGNASKSTSFTADAGDVIYVSLYKYSSSGSTGTGTFYVSGASYPTSTATASVSTISGLIYDNNSSYEYVVEYDENYTLPIPHRTGYTFDGWYFGSNKIESGIWAYTTDMTLTAKWDKNTYTITFDADGGECNTTSQTVVFDESYSLPTPTRTGYTFAGWYSGSTNYTGGTWTTASNVTLTASWTANGDIPYVVNHHKQNIAGTGYEAPEVQNLTGVAGASIKPAVKSYTGFTSPSVKTVTVAPDGTLVVDYYYTRNSYSITLVTNGGDSITTITQKYQSSVTVPNATRTGYTFGGWYTDKALTTEYTGTTISASNITLYAYWAEENKPGDFTYSGTSAITVSAYSGTSTTMWIPAYIGGVPVTKIPASAFANQTTLTKVVIPETVTEIGEGALKGCSALEDLTIPFVGSSASADQTNAAVFGYIFGRYTSSASSKPTGTVYQGWGYRNDSYLITETSGSNYAYSSYRYADYYYIPTTIKKVTVTVDTTMPYGAFQNCDFIESITIPSATTSIGAFAFKNCKGLTEMSLGTALTSIGRYAFAGCITLEKVTMPNSVSSIGTYTFDGCVALTKINSTTEGVAVLPTSLTSIPAYAFQNCSGITNISVTNITSVGTYAFNGCNYIIRINGSKDGELILPNGLTTIGAYAFQNLAEITKIVVPNTVTEIGVGAFKGCISLADITLPFIGKTAESSQSNEAVFGHIFGMYGSSASSKPTGTVYQGWSYKNDSYLITGTYGNNYSNSSYYRADYYYIPTTIKNVTITVDTTIPYGAFQNCDFIESISILSTTTSIDAFAFRNCKGLTTMNLGTTLTSIGRYAFSGCISLESISIPNTVSSIGSHAFDGCITLKKMNSSTEGTISLPTSLTSISSYIFQGCTEITKVVVGDITSIGAYAFSGCENITQFNSNTDGQLIIPNGVTTIGECAFQNLSSITKIVVPNTVTEIGDGAFKGCSALEDITLPFIGKTESSSASAEATFGYIFGKYASAWSSTSSKPTGTIYQGWECYSSSYLTSGTLGKNYAQSSYYRADYYYIPTTIKSVTITQDTNIPYGAFHNCDFIESITLPTTITSIGEYAFMNCDGLTAMSLGTKLTSLGANAFEGCINLTTISIPNTVESIGSNAFNGCAELKRMNSTTDGVIVLPTSVTTLSSYVFKGCTSITKMVVGDITSIGTYALSGCENITQFNSSVNGELIVPSGVKTIGEYAFQNLASITKVVVPDTVTEIGEGAFKGCNAIENITLPFIGKTATASGSSDALFGYIFGRYASSASTTPTGTVYQGWGTYSSSYPTSGTSGKNYHQSSYYYAHYYYIPSTIKNVTITVDTTIPYGAFQNCSFIETIVLPTTVTSVGNYAYQNCSATVSQTYETKTDMSWDGTTVATDFGSGDGTQANPYIISTGAELALLSQKVNDGETFAGVYFKLAKNISLNGKTFTTIGSKNNKFEGIFDGNGCVISNFKISTSESYAGLFGYVSGTIQNLGVQGTVSVSGTSANAYVGMIAGYNTGTIQNCYASGSVTLSSANTTHAGGLVGYNEGNIVNSYATTNVTSTSTGYMAYAGGLVGYAKSGKISGSYASGDVKAYGTSSDYSRNGGLVGFLNSDATLENCYRSELQLLTRYTTAGSAYCEEGTSASIETIKAYVSSNWSSVIWSFNNTHPRFVEN